jgi:hypothetical protein
METRIKICDICKKEVRENDKIDFSSFAKISIDFQDRWCLVNPEMGLHIFNEMIKAKTVCFV